MHQETPAAARRRTPGSRSRADPSPGAPALPAGSCSRTSGEMPRRRSPNRADSGTALRTQPPRACCRRPTSPPLPRTATIMHHRLSPPPGLQGRVAFEQVAAAARGTRVCQAEVVSPGEPGTAVALPDPALVVLVGASGSGKSAWAAEHYRPDEVISSDRLRALVGSGEHDLDASADAFALLDQIVAARLRRGLTAVVDTLGLDPARRRSYLALAKSSGMPAAVVLVDTDPAECQRRNRARDRPVPAPALEGQLRRMRAAVAEIPGEGWDLVTTAGQAQPEASHTPGAKMAASQQRQRPVRMGPVLQLSRFPWGE